MQGGAQTMFIDDTDTGSAEMREVHDPDGHHGASAGYTDSAWSAVYSPWLTAGDLWMPDSMSGFEGPAWTLLPWWLRIEPVWQGAGRNNFTESYPLAFPYFPVPAFEPLWADPWSMQPYHNVWWG